MLDEMTKEIFASFGISARDVEKSAHAHMHDHMLETRLGGGGFVDVDGTVYGRGSREGRMGEVRAPGTRRVSGVRVRSARFAVDGYR